MYSDWFYVISLILSGFGSFIGFHIDSFLDRFYRVSVRFYPVSVRFYRFRISARFYPVSARFYRFRLDFIGSGSILSVSAHSIDFGSILSDFGSILSVRLDPIGSAHFYRFGSILSGFGSILSVSAGFYPVSDWLYRFRGDYRFHPIFGSILSVSDWFDPVLVRFYQFRLDYIGFGSIRSGFGLILSVRLDSIGFR